jgi:GntR family transcriptional regulator, rspAB operon transcriptional repressor
MIAPVRSRATQAPQVFETLRASIIEIKLAPGTPLSRTALQQQFHVSSTPIRDALMRLEEIGLVDVFPQSGTLVSLIDVPQARQAQFLRLSVELEAVRKLASSPDPSALRQMRDAIAEQRKWAKSGNLKKFTEADLAFHGIFYSASGVDDLWTLVRQQSAHMDRIRRLHLPIGTKTAQIIRDHLAIMRAIDDGDPDRAQSALRGHLSQSLAFTDELRVRFPEYFKG